MIKVVYLKQQDFWLDRVTFISDLRKRFIKPK